VDETRLPGDAAPRSPRSGAVRKLLCLLLCPPLLLVTATACAKTGQTPSATTPGIPLGSAPSAVVHFCAARARLGGFATLCPSRYPHERNSNVETSGTAVRPPSYYWASFNDPTGFPQGVIGGQAKPFVLDGVPGKLWPRKGASGGPVFQLPIPRLRTTPMAGGGTFTIERPSHVIERSKVGEHPALVLMAPPYPLGDLSGGHIIVVWDAYGHGYFVSPHLAVGPHGLPYSLRQRIEAALAIARSCRRIG
jgi:hypothetical protein